VLGLLIILHSIWTLIANNRRLPQKSLILTSLLLVAISGIVLVSGISNNMINNNNQAQAQEQQQQQRVGQTKINKLWETLDDLKNPESVVYAPKQNILFVSNVDGKPDQKDQNGFISKVSPSNGSIVELNWITGLNAPKGMAIHNNSRLYVSDITDLVEMDIASGKIIKRFNAPGSSFLNDVALDNQGNIYVSDTITNTIYKLDTNAKDNNTSLQAWLQSPQLNGPNGLHVDNNKNRLIVASLGDMSKPGAGIEVVDLKNKTISSLGKEGTTSPFGGLDGIESDATETHYYVTDNPAGKIYTVSADGTRYATLIDLHIQGTADLGFIPSQSMIILPLMQDNKLVAYKLVE
jgi:hypothetical protein